jgi:acyl-CoA reductase-like NAD-dependent aldehyde dehydrogenase
MATTRKSKTAAETLKSFNPQKGEVIGEVRANSPGEVADIVAHARKVAPEWGGIDPQGRARILKEVRIRLYERMDHIIDTVAAECGKPRAEALAFDVVPTMLNLLYHERTAPKFLRPQKVGRFIGPVMGAASHIDWRPYGVVGCITPWNYPVYNCFLAMTSALFAGNTIVVKPSEVTPQVGECIRELLEPLPTGVATVIQGGADVGAALVDAPCDKISFVGSPLTGRKIAEAAAKHLTPVVMELGGKDAAVVCSDADLDIATSGILWGSFFNAGQTCCSIERVFVVDSIADEFKDRLVTKLAEITQGEDGDVGSLTFPRQLEIVERHVSDAVAKGATVLSGGPGTGPQNKNGSLWYAPTILEGVSDEMDVAKEETFGPVLTIARVQDEEEAVRRSNEGVNLTASVWTKDTKKAYRLARNLRAGTISINAHAETGGAPWTPWGGVGESGYGRLNGELGLKEFSVPVHISRSVTGKRKHLWWYPYNEATTETLRSLAAVLGAPSLTTKLGALRKVVGSATRAFRSKI